jgi:signal transduction histidine kinase
MFKQSKRRIVASIMAILVVVWVGSLAVIYGSSYAEMSRHNREMLSSYAQSYDPYRPDNPDIPKGPAPDGKGEKRFDFSTFYAVALSSEGEVISTEIPDRAAYTEEEVISTAKSIVSTGKTKGRTDNLTYSVTQREQYTIVAFLDNTMVNDNVSTLLRYTFIFGAIALVVFFFVARHLADRIVKPLEESYDKQKRFISDAGHELKTPVSVVNANAELLEREIGRNQWLENIQYENERMGNLVTQLLDLARLENVETVKEEVNFSKVTAGEALPFESVAFEKGISLETEIEDDVLVEGNSAQLKQVVSILIDNALRHSKGDKVSVALKKTHGQAVLSVTNEGDEIPPEQRERIFERFYRADEARTGGENNYGLGLAIAKSVADSHGGTLSVNCRDGLVEFIFKI